MLIQKNNTSVPLQAVLNTTGLTALALISKNGGAFATPAGGATLTEVGHNLYKLPIAAADFDTLGPIALSFSGTSVSTATLYPAAEVVSHDPYNTVLAIQSLDTAIKTDVETAVYVTLTASSAFDGYTFEGDHIILAPAGTVKVTQKTANRWLADHPIIFTQS